MTATDPRRAGAVLWNEQIDNPATPPALRQATEDQREAANPEATAWVAASAGTGKTRVLTNRLLALLLEGAAPQHILALTFTKAAAAEMANRVSEALEEWVTLSDDSLRAALFKLAGAFPSEEQMALARRLFAKVLEAPGGLNIQTIHAFAQSLLGRFPVEAGVQPGFKVLEDSESSALLERAIDRFLAGLFSRDDPKVSQVFEVMGDEAFRDVIAALVRERGRLSRLRGPNKRPAPDILSPLREFLGLQAETQIKDLEWAIIHPDGIPADLSAAMRAFADFAQAENIKPHSKNRPMFEALKWFELARPEDRLAEIERFTNLFTTGSGTKRVVGGMLLKTFKEDEEAAFEALCAEQERVWPLINAIRACRQMAVSEALLDTAGAVVDDYAVAKRAASRVDFDDLILKTIDLLTAESGAGLWVSYKLDQGLRHVLVDEAQDTNPDQWAIIRGLTQAFYDGTNGDADAPRTAFVVGDLKQSIYGFQRADPQVFQDMKTRFQADVERAEQHWIPKSLNVTFRSSQPILDAVNTVFSHGDNARGLTFDDEGWPVHLTGRPGAGGLVEVWQPVEAAPKDKDAPVTVVRPDDDLDEDDRPEIELAKILGERISQWTDGTARAEGDPGWLANRGRPMVADDVLVLVRSRSGPFINTLTYTLKKAGVQVAGADRMKLQEQQAIKDLLRLTEFLLQPADDLALATVLRSPICGFSEDQLFRLAHRRGKDETLEKALSRAAHEGGATAEASAAYTLFQTLRNRLASTPHSFYSALLTRMEAGLRFSERLGPQAADAVKEFMRATLTFERNNTPTLPGFLGWLSKAEIEVKREQEGDNGGVRIMTVHGSKGLEAPVVILPHTHKRMDDVSRDRLRWFSPEGEADGGLPLPYWKPSAEDSPERTLELEAADKERAAEEERRLLYVAMTRAEDRLYICGWKPKNKANKDSKDAAKSVTWFDTIEAAFKAEAASVERLSPAPESVAAPIYRLSLASSLATKQDKDNQNEEDRDHSDPSEQTEAVPVVPSPSQLAALRGAIPAEPSPPRPFTPSQLPDDPAAPSPMAALQALRGKGRTARGSRGSSPFFRGTVLHGLLQRLPELPVAERADAARRYLSRPSLDLMPAQIDAWGAEVLAITNDDQFAALFGGSSRAEVAVTGLVGEMVVSGQIDRLVEHEDEVWVVDYKSNRPPPTDPAHVAESYRAQLAAYKAVLEGLYPGKTIRTFLLWTEAPRLMEVPVNRENLPLSANAHASD